MISKHSPTPVEEYDGEHDIRAHSEHHREERDAGSYAQLVRSFLLL